MNDYFAITKEGISPRIVALTIDKDAQKLLNSEFEKAKILFFNKESKEVTKEENGEKKTITIHTSLAEEDYSPGYETNNSLLKIENFDIGLKIVETFNNPTNARRFDISNIAFQDIIAIFTFDYNTRECFIQLYNSSKFINMNKTLFFIKSKKEMTAGKDIEGIKIDNKLVATLRIKENNNVDLLFRNFNNAKRIFKNLSSYFEEATNPILKDFVNLHFETSPNFDITEIANTQTRKQIALINHYKVLQNEDITTDSSGKSIRKYTDKTALEINELAKKFDVDLPLNNAGNKVILPQNITELNELLCGFASLIYYSPVNGIRMKANSAKAYPKK